MFKRNSIPYNVWMSSIYLFTLISGKYFSPDFGGRTFPSTVSPVFNPNNFI